MILEKGTLKYDAEADDAASGFPLTIKSRSECSLRDLLSMVERRVHIVDVFLAQTVFGQAQALAKSLEVYNLPLAQEADGVGDVRIIAEAKNVVVGYAGFLLCCDLVRTTFDSRKA